MKNAHTNKNPRMRLTLTTFPCPQLKSNSTPVPFRTRPITVSSRHPYFRCKPRKLVQRRTSVCHRWRCGTLRIWRSCGLNRRIDVVCTVHPIAKRIQSEGRVAKIRVLVFSTRKTARMCKRFETFRPAPRCCTPIKKDRFANSNQPSGHAMAKQLAFMLPWERSTKGAVQMLVKSMRLKTNNLRPYIRLR